jgi:hypothetical protein
MNVAAYAHCEIQLEGLREKLQLNPLKFRSHEEIFADLKTRLPKWSLLDGGHLEARVGTGLTEFRDDVARFQLEVQLKNRGVVTFKDYHVDILVPARLLEGDNATHVHEVVENRTSTHYFFRFPAMHDSVAPLYPGDERRVFALNLLADRERFLNPSLRSLEFEVRAYAEGNVHSATRSVQEMFESTKVKSHFQSSAAY